MEGQQRTSPKEAMMTRPTLRTSGFIVVTAFLAVVLARFTTQAATSPSTVATPTRGFAQSSTTGQQFPMLNKIANKVIQKYQGSTCEQLSQERSAKQGQPKSPEEQKVIGLLQSDPQRREAFLNMVAVPIANKLFECGMIP
jgi:hypothetical protein